MHNFTIILIISLFCSLFKFNLHNLSNASLTLLLVAIFVKIIFFNPVLIPNFFIVSFSCLVTFVSSCVSLIIKLSESKLTISSIFSLFVIMSFDKILS